MSSNVAKLNTTVSFQKPIYLATVLTRARKLKRSWRVRFLRMFFPRQDLNYLQFQHLEAKRTRQQMKREAIS